MKSRAKKITSEIPKSPRRSLRHHNITPTTYRESDDDSDGLSLPKIQKLDHSGVNSSNVKKKSQPRKSSVLKPSTSHNSQQSAQSSSSMSISSSATVDNFIVDVKNMDKAVLVYVEKGDKTRDWISHAKLPYGVLGKYWKVVDDTCRSLKMSANQIDMDIHKQVEQEQFSLQELVHIRLLDLEPPMFANLYAYYSSNPAILDENYFRIPKFLFKCPIAPPPVPNPSKSIKDIQFETDSVVTRDEAEEPDMTLVKDETVLSTVNDGKNLIINGCKLTFKSKYASGNIQWMCSKRPKSVRCPKRVTTTGYGIDKNVTFISETNEHEPTCRDKTQSLEDAKADVKEFMEQMEQNGHDPKSFSFDGSYLLHCNYIFSKLNDRKSNVYYRCRNRLHGCNARLVIEKSSSEVKSMANAHTKYCSELTNLYHERMSFMANYVREDHICTDQSEEASIKWLLYIHSHVYHSNPIQWWQPNLQEIFTLVKLSDFQPGHFLFNIKSPIRLSTVINQKKREYIFKEELSKWTQGNVDKLVKLVQDDDNDFVDWCHIAIQMSSNDVSVTSKSCTRCFVGYLNEKYRQPVKDIVQEILTVLRNDKNDKKSKGLILQDIIIKISSSSNIPDSVKNDHLLIKAIIKYFIHKMTGPRSILHRDSASKLFSMNPNYKPSGNASWGSGPLKDGEGGNHLTDCIDAIDRLRALAKEDVLVYDEKYVVAEIDNDSYGLIELTQEMIEESDLCVQLEESESSLLTSILKDDADSTDKAKNKDLKNFYSSLSSGDDVYFETTDKDEATNIEHEIKNNPSLANKLFMFGCYDLEKQIEGVLDVVKVFVFTSRHSLYLSVANNYADMKLGKGCFSVHDHWVECYRPNFDSFRIIALAKGMKATFQCKWTGNMVADNHSNFREGTVGKVSSNLLNFFTARLYDAGVIFKKIIESYFIKNEVISFLTAHNITLEFGTNRKITNKKNLKLISTE